MWIYDINKEKNIYIQKGKYARVKGHRTNNWFYRSFRMYSNLNDSAYRSVLWAKQIMNINSDLSEDERQIQNRVFDAVGDIMASPYYPDITAPNNILEAVMAAPTKRKQIALLTVLTSGTFYPNDCFAMPPTAICMANWEAVVDAFFNWKPVMVSICDNADRNVGIPLFTRDY